MPNASQHQLEENGFCFSEYANFRYPGDRVGGEGEWKHWLHYKGPLEILEYTPDKWGYDSAVVKVPGFPPVEVTATTNFPGWQASPRLYRTGTFGEGNTVSAGV